MTVTYFPVQVTTAANVRDTTITVAALSSPIDALAIGTGINPISYTVTTAANASAAATSITIAPSPQIILVGSTIFFSSSPNTPVVVSANVPIGATTLPVQPLTDPIPSGTASSGAPIPPATSNPTPPGPGTGTAPPPDASTGPVIKIRRVSLRYPNPAIDANGFPR